MFIISLGNTSIIILTTLSYLIDNPITIIIYITRAKPALTINTGVLKNIFNSFLINDLVFDLDLITKLSIFTFFDVEMFFRLEFILK